MVITSLFLITYQTQKLIKIPQHTILGYGMVLIVENYQDTTTRGIFRLGLTKKHSEDSLTLRLLLLSTSNLHWGFLVPQTNNRIKGNPLSFGELICFIGLWLLVT